MCYAIPGKIVELKGKIAVIDYFGEHKNALNEFVNAQVGDYVYAQGGILVDKIDEDDAIPILSF
ncbi:MAG: HypC/HybG/HupF family hydrogenase formation chaperone, partial [Nanoarchaeota archaeon]|nr:HypC/HybG/HupF family hydrogenase formation chaperone [Nanoarchaeota archaeon]